MNMDTMHLELGFSSPEAGSEYAQEASFNAGTTRYRDAFNDAWTSFQPDTIVAGGAGRLTAGMNSMDVETQMPIDYDYKPPALTPDRPGRLGNGTPAHSDHTPFSQFD